MSVPNALLAVLSLLYLSTILTFVMALIEQEEWANIWRETRRRWLKLMGILGLIAVITVVMTVVSDRL